MTKKSLNTFSKKNINHKYIFYSLHCDDKFSLSSHLFFVSKEYFGIQILDIYFCPIFKNLKTLFLDIYEFSYTCREYFYIYQRFSLLHYVEKNRENMPRKYENTKFMNNSKLLNF